MSKWTSVAGSILKVAPGLAGDVIQGGVKGFMAIKKLKNILSKDPKKALEMINDVNIETDTVIKFVESLRTNKIDFDYLKSKKVVVTLIVNFALVLLIAFKPDAAQQNANIIQLLIGLTTVAVGGQAVIDNKKVGK